MPIQDSGKSACPQSQLNSPLPSRHLAGFVFSAYRLESVQPLNMHFQKRISQVLEGTDGALCQMDDILVCGKSVGERNQHLEATLHKLQEANLTLNEEKCKFSKPSVEFLRTLVDSSEEYM